MPSALMARAVQFMRHPPRMLPDSHGCISTRLAEGRLLSHIDQLLDRRITLIVYCVYPYQGGMGDLKCEKTGISMGTKRTRPHEHEAVVSQGEREGHAILALEGMTCASCAMRIVSGRGDVTVMTRGGRMRYHDGQQVVLPERPPPYHQC